MRHKSMIFSSVLSLWVLSLACGRSSLNAEPFQKRSNTPVENITVLQEKGGRLDWSSTKDLIVFDREGEDGLFDIYTMNPDGSKETCLTCEVPGASSKNNGNPAWHPSGDYIVFQAEKEEHPGLSSFSNPGLGKDNDLWLMTSDGKTYYQLTDIDLRLAILHPHFSHDGKKLLWAEMIARESVNSDSNGEWALKIADLVMGTDNPTLENIQIYQPLGPVFYESHGFSPDDQVIVFTAFFDPNSQESAWLDIFTLSLATEKHQSLTRSIDAWDEHAQFSPSGDKIVWMSSTDCECNPQRLSDLRTDLWIMNTDGSGKLRLTHFSDRRYPEFLGLRSIAADSAWSPDGKRLALYVIEGISPRGTIVMIEFNAAQ